MKDAFGMVILGVDYLQLSSYLEFMSVELK